MIRIGSVEVPGEGSSNTESYEEATSAHVFVPRPRRVAVTWEKTELEKYN